MSRLQIETGVGGSILLGANSRITLQRTDFTTLNRAIIEVFAPPSSIVMESDGAHQSKRWKRKSIEVLGSPLILRRKKGQSFTIDDSLFVIRLVTTEALTLTITADPGLLIEQASEHWVLSYNKKQLLPVGSCVFWSEATAQQSVIFRGIIQAWQETGSRRIWRPTIGSIQCKHLSVLRKGLRRLQPSWEDCSPEAPHFSAKDLYGAEEEVSHSLALPERVQPTPRVENGAREVYGLRRRRP